MAVLVKRLWILSIEIPEGIKVRDDIKPIMYFLNEDICNKVAIEVLNMGYKILKAYDIITG